MPLTGPGMIVFAQRFSGSERSAFASRLRDRATRTSQNTNSPSQDCHFVRREFEYEKFDEYTYPSADLQLGAESVDAVARGEYQWVLAELHPPVALLHHGFFWSCPDQEALAAALAKGQWTENQIFTSVIFAADFTATTTVRLLTACRTARTSWPSSAAIPKWRVIPPAEVEVFIDEQNGDVRLRTRATREDLGSFARAWTIPLGFHPFSFLVRHAHPAPALRENGRAT